MRVPLPMLHDQRTAVLPDGSVDPGSLTDCGEACVASCCGGFRGDSPSVGCVRQMLDRADSSGLTTAADLSRLCMLLGLRGQGPERNVRSLRAHVRRATRSYRYVLLLGHFQGPAELHWVVAYHAGVRDCWVMDPWVGEFRGIDWDTCEALWSGVSLRVSAL